MSVDGVAANSERFGNLVRAFPHRKLLLDLFPLGMGADAALRCVSAHVAAEETPLPRERISATTAATSVMTAWTAIGTCAMPTETRPFFTSLCCMGRGDKKNKGRCVTLSSESSNPSRCH
jgi:hypothetical protein